jgi:hypothetical protein
VILVVLVGQILIRRLVNSAPAGVRLDKENRLAGRSA